MDKVMNVNNVKDMLDNWMKWGTMFLVSRVLTYSFIDRSQDLFNKSWFFDSLFTLLGFSLYFIFVRHMVPKVSDSPLMHEIIDDWAKFGTMLVGSHVITTTYFGGELFNMTWVMQSLFILIGFTVYRGLKGVTGGMVGTQSGLIVEKFVPERSLKDVAPVVEDSLMFGTMLVTVQLLNGGSLYDKNWLLTSLFMLAGFASYNVFTKNLIKFN